MNWTQNPGAVCIYRLEGEGWPEAADFARAGRELMEALAVRPDPSRRRVFVKPNVVLGVAPDSGISVHPAFVSGIVDYLGSIGYGPDRVLVGEGGGGETTRDMSVHFGRAGYEEHVASRGVKLVDLNSDDHVRVPIPDGRVFKEMPIARTVKDPEAFFLNLAKLKTHNFGITTLCMKNLMGIVVPIEERHMCSLFPRWEGDRGGSGLQTEGIIDTHERWANKICDIYLAAKPDLNVVEGIVGRDGTGFNRGENLPVRVAIAGANPVAVDTLASYVMGFDPAKLTYLRVAGERGLGPNRVEDLDIYEVGAGGGLKPCGDPERFVTRPRFRVILAERFRYSTYEDVEYVQAEAETFGGSI